MKRASPMPPFAYFAAKVVLSMIFSAGLSFHCYCFLWASSSAVVRLPAAEHGQAARNIGGRITSLFLHGIGHRLFRRTKFRTRRHQSDLFTTLVLQWLVGALHVSS